ncbi:hypothetical protein [Salegentibacter mishustinae]|uniref:Uncharacterized protein n=1 Tax=Salegentibacter mishustinae TaxID=270918 RepID=A0A0Q9ZH92_9FLAO|nr:hypothetical protein [Salegentibacter mishustinae]KRG29034.1 hypothetical protein APR42_03655 [Salegentibacter mishustinae]PNW21914.1 hypothetical protein APB85_11835 [Salegentibacter mishustinae]PZX65265.1 hypothetical protein LY54_01558 [Salegentibacter mishustinae]GGW86231.1 hypothetical protein GCM10008086_13180 [Salegentibacter mishustinae]
MIKKFTKEESLIIDYTKKGELIDFELDFKNNPKIVIDSKFLINLILGFPLPNKHDDYNSTTIYPLTRKGLNLSGVRIKGVLNLSVSLGTSPLPPLTFRNCIFEGDSLDYYKKASLRPKPSFSSTHCHFSNLKIENCKIGFCDFKNSKFQSDLIITELKPLVKNGICMIDLSRIDVKGMVSISRTILNLADRSTDLNIPYRRSGIPSNYALTLADSRINNSLFLRPYFRVKNGGVNLCNTIVCSDFWCDGSQIKAKKNNWALFCQSLKVYGTVGFTGLHFQNEKKNKDSDLNIISKEKVCQICKIEGKVSFLSAKLGEALFSGCQIKKLNEDDQFIFSGSTLNRLTINQWVFLNPTTKKEEYHRFESEMPFIFSESAINGSVKILNANLPESLFSNNVKIEGDLNIEDIKTPTISFANSEVQGSVSLNGTIETFGDFSGLTVNGDFSLSSISQQLVLKKLSNKSIKINLEDTIIRGNLKIYQIKVSEYSPPEWTKKNYFFRKRELTCFQNITLIEGVFYENKNSKEIYTVSFLEKNAKYIYLKGKVLDFISKDFSKSLLLKTDQQIKDYLKFFTAFVWGEEGSFRIIESREELAQWVSLNESSTEEEKMINQIEPIEKLQQDKDYFYAKANVLYKDTLYDTSFKINTKNGKIEMQNDKPKFRFQSTKVFFEDIYRKIRPVEFLDFTHVPPPLGKATEWKMITETTSNYHSDILEKNFTSKVQKPIINLQGTKATWLEDNQGKTWDDVILNLNGFSYEHFGELPEYSNKSIYRSENKVKKPNLRILWRIIIVAALLYLFYISYLWILIIIILIITLSIKIYKKRKNFNFKKSLEDFIKWIFYKPKEKLPKLKPLKWGKSYNHYKLRKFWLLKQFSTWPPKKEDYKPQPFEQAAKVFKQNGQYKESIYILISKLRIERGLFYPWFQVPLMWIWDHFFGFGIKTWIVLRTFVLFFLIGWASVSLANSGKLSFSWKNYNYNLLAIAEPVLIVDVNSVTSYATSYEENFIKVRETAIPTLEGNFARVIPCGNNVEPSLYALDVFVPLLDLKQDTECKISGEPTALPWRIAKALYALLGWIITSVLILTLSGYLKREVEK